MKFTLNQPQTFSEQGQKSNQEDRIAPVRTSMNRATRCFVLCDGMGGHEHGEVAAEIVSQSLYEALTAGAEEPDLMSDERFKIALAKSYTALDRMEVGEGKRPGTTMTCLYFAENGVLAAHIGDSRIYQIRPGRGVIFKTRDHSLVNDLIRAGELTEEEAVNYPRKNVITRAMQPGLDRPYRADIAMLTDVRPGDYFFMCSDGILEQLSDSRLTEIVGKENGAQEKIQEVFDVCFNKTRDNFTCILIPVENVEGAPGKSDEQTISAVVTDIPVSGRKPANAARSGSRVLIPVLVGIAAVVAAGVIFFLTSGGETPETAETEVPGPEQAEQAEDVEGPIQNLVEEIQENFENEDVNPEDLVEEKAADEKKTEAKADTKEVKPAKKKDNKKKDKEDVAAETAKKAKEAVKEIKAGVTGKSNQDDD